MNIVLRGLAGAVVAEAQQIIGIRRHTPRKGRWAAPSDPVLGVQASDTEICAT